MLSNPLFFLILPLLTAVGGQATDIIAEGAAEVEGSAEQQGQTDRRTGEGCTEDEAISPRRALQVS